MDTVEAMVAATYAGALDLKHGSNSFFGDHVRVERESLVRWEWTYYGSPDSPENRLFIDYLVDREIVATTNAMWAGSSDHGTMTTPDLESRRLDIYSELARTGRVGSAAELAERWGVTAAEASTVLEALAAQRHVALDEAGAIVLAHPFATRDFGFSVKSDHVLWWGGCAWDSFAIPHLVPGACPSLVATTCPNCGTAHAWNVGRDAAPAGDQVAHFLVPMARVWNDVVHACSHQRIFCSEDCVDAWVATSAHPRGEVFSLDTLWRLASDWYTGRLDRGYTRREPVAAAAYFASVGLTGAFWGN